MIYLKKKYKNIINYYILVRNIIAKVMQYIKICNVFVENHGNIMAKKCPTMFFQQCGLEMIFCNDLKHCKFIAKFLAFYLCLQCID